MPIKNNIYITLLSTDVQDKTQLSWQSNKTYESFMENIPCKKNPILNSVLVLLVSTCTLDLFSPYPSSSPERPCFMSNLLRKMKGIEKEDSLVDQWFSMPFDLLKISTEKNPTIIFFLAYKERNLEQYSPFLLWLYSPSPDFSILCITCSQKKNISPTT